VIWAAMQTAGDVSSGVGTQNGSFDDCQEGTVMVSEVVAYVMARLKREEEGQGLVEYGLVIFLVSIVSISALMGLSTAINGLFRAIDAVLP
jgi:Flp pilus assembly pilin Flp